MCQMCDEYENELVRMGLIEDARKFREERAREHGKGAIASKLATTQEDKPREPR